MKNAPDQISAESVPDKTHSSKFTGTSNTRHLRAIQALLTSPQRREHLDQIAGCSNGPDLVAALRRRGLEIPCVRVLDHDRDGVPISRGIYHFTGGDRQAVNRWLSSRGK